jgi:hypothetical protein
LLVRTNALWRVAKAGTEKPVEVGNIGKASLQYHGKQTSFLVYCEQMGDHLCANSLHSGLCKVARIRSYVIVHKRFVQALIRIAAGQVLTRFDND